MIAHASTADTWQGVTSHTSQRLRGCRRQYLRSAKEDQRVIRKREPKKEIHMRPNGRRFGAYVGMTAFLAMSLGLHTKRHWSQLGMIDRVVVLLIWFSVFASIAAIAVTIWRYIKAQRAKANSRSVA